MVKSDNKVIHLQLNNAKEELIAEQIEQGMAKVYETRQSIGFDKQVQRNKDYYECVVDPNRWGPWEGSAKYFMGIITTHIDIIAIKALRQSVGIHPIMQLLPDTDEVQPEDLRDREDNLDYVLRNELKIDKLLKAGVYREACIQGASFVKVCHTRQVENVTSNRVYRPKDIEQYKLDSWQELDHSEEKIAENIGKLIVGEEVIVRVDEERVIHDGPKAYRVPIEDLFIRTDIKEMSRQRLIAERLHYTWKDIQERLDDGYFRKEAIKKIRGDNEDDYFMKDYELFECILYAKLDGKFQRYVITYEPDSKAILRAIHYPYAHGQIYYVPYYIKERDDCAYGYSIVDMLADSNDYINDLINGILDRTSLDNNPVLRVPLKSRLDAYKWGPNARFPADEKIEVISTQNRSVDDTQILGIMKQFAETLGGVSAGILSGQVSPSDPTGPAAKQAMQTQESNFRIEDYIISLQHGNEILAEQAEELKKQYDYEGFSDELKQVIDLPVMYQAHGTTLSINKSQQLAIIKEFIGILQVLAPDVLQDAPRRRKLILLTMNNMGGQIEQNKKDLLPEEIGSMAQAPGDPNAGIGQALDEMSPEEQEALMASIESMRGM